MIYCISDIHGCYDEFMELLKEINFNENDTLYVLGDVIDRGPKPIETLRFIMQTPNVHFLIGNHEQMMLDHYDGNDIYENWNTRNGADTTKNQLKKMKKEEINEILSYLRQTPFFYKVKVNGQNYRLVHAAVDPGVSTAAQDPDFMVWAREEFFEKKGSDKFKVIFGHTPTMYWHKNSCHTWEDPVHNDKIGIDGGCAYNGCLIALCLNNMETFYVKSY